MKDATNGQRSRREFLRTAGMAAFAAGVGYGKKRLAQEKPKSFRARAVLIRHKDAVGPDGQPRADIVRQMLDEAVMALTGEEKALDAWRHYVHPDDVLGIKSNVWSYLPTPPAILDTITARARKIGVPRKNIGIDDRGVRRNPLFQKATALINARPVRTHHWAGIGGCLKNYIMFVPEPSAYHPDECADLGAIWKLQNLKERTRLNILCALTPLFYGRGPHHFSRTYVWPYGGLFVGTDPVALDALGARLLEAKRIDYFGENRPLDTSPKHVEIADRRHGIGCSNLEQIELIRLGWMEDALI